MRILLTNDDGIQAPGLRSLYKALLDEGHKVHVVAPVTEQSAVGHALTIFQPLRLKEFKEKDFYGHGVYGTPVDCVKLALCSLLPEKPDLVLSGINAGANVGVDILYSGTVSAATDGALMGMPAMAVSYDDFLPPDLSEHAGYIAKLVKRAPWSSLPPQTVLNVNFPARKIEECLGLRVCPQTKANYDDTYEQRIDPRGRAYYWLYGFIPADRVNRDSDRDLLNRGYITLTPLRFDFTDYENLAMLGAALGEGDA